MAMKVQKLHVSIDDILQAQNRIQKFVHVTPVLTSTKLDELSKRKVFYKAENFQKTGSFKARGALNAVLSLKERHHHLAGVACHSSGNHGIAVAYAAQLAQLPCTVVVPEDTPATKVDAIREYGAQLVFCKTSNERREVCAKIISETSRIEIPPYDHVDTIAGQGTIAVELFNQVPDLDAILVPTSGGGMASGIAIATKALNERTKVFAVEPEGKELEKCLRSGKRLWPNPPKYLDTIAEGIKTQQLGHMTFPIFLQLVEKCVFTVKDEEMVTAMKLVFQRMKLVIEASSAAGVAAVMSSRLSEIRPKLDRVAVILCGGNVDIENLPW